jgi:peptidyl-prolyl cis-trans isomerase C
MLEGVSVQHLDKFLLLMAALLLAACGSVSAASPTGDVAAISQANPLNQQQVTLAVTPAPATLPTNADGEPVVARVNGTDITLADFQRTLARYEQQQPNVADASVLQTAVLNTMIEQVVIEQAAVEQEIAVSDAELDAEIQSNIALAGSDSAWQDWLNVNQYTSEEFRETLRDTMMTGRVLDVVTQDLHGDVPHVHARHILVETEAEAQELLNRLNNGEDFAALAAEYSLDETTARQGGDLGWFTEDELLEPALARAAFALEPNMVTGPIQTMLGYHIIQTLERDDRPISEERLPEVMQARFEHWVDSLVATATIERYL